MTDIQDIDLLLESKEKTDKAIAEYAEKLQGQLDRLNGVIKPPKKRRIGSLLPKPIPSIPVTGLFRSALVKGVLLVLVGAAIGYGVHVLPSITKENPPAVQPVEETLEEFVAREAGRLLTDDERAKLTTVAEKVLHQDFTRPSAIVEEFSFQRRVAGINSPAFNAFSDKWAEKVEKMQTENVESMRQIYQSLLRGLQEVKATVDFSDEPVEVFSLQSFSSNVTPEAATEDVPDSSDILPSLPTEPVEGKPPQVEEQRPAVQRQRLFR